VQSMINEYAAKIIKFEEENNQFKDTPYRCSEGYPTIGWGFRIAGTSKGDPLPNITMTIEHGNFQLEKMINSYVGYLSAHPLTKPSWDRMNDDRRSVMLSMVHQVGEAGILAFKGFLRAAESGDFGLAAYEMYDSKAYRQSTNRWTRQAIVMASGEVSSIPVWGC